MYLELFFLSERFLRFVFIVWYVLGVIIVWYIVYIGSADNRNSRINLAIDNTSIIDS